MCCDGVPFQRSSCMYAKTLRYRRGPQGSFLSRDRIRTDSLAHGRCLARHELAFAVSSVRRHGARRSVENLDTVAQHGAWDHCCQ
eukprot:scaffold1090_cov265-Pinguiococcus_pyrenoidosus.AAC.9